MKSVVISRAGGYEELQIVDYSSESAENEYEYNDSLKRGLRGVASAREREAREGFLVGYQSGFGRRGCVLIRTVACGVNYADVCVRWGLYASAKEYVGWPITPGFEFSGVVEAVWDGELNEGENQTGNQHDTSPELKLAADKALQTLQTRGIGVGTRVFGVTRFGAYSTHVIVPADQIFSLDNFGFAADAAPLSMVEAAAFPAVFLTAYFAMHELVHPHDGDIILVHSAAGGVGSALCQLGRIAGATVVGVVGSSHKVDACREFGAHHVIDKSTENLWIRARELSPRGFDAVYDANGVETLSQSYDNLSSGGKLVVYGFHTMLPKTGGRTNIAKLAWNWLRTPTFNPLDMTSANKSVLALNLSFLFNQRERFFAIVDRLMAWFSDGSLKPPRVTTYPMSEVADAHAAIESGTTVGKLVLLTGGEESRVDAQRA